MRKLAVAVAALPLVLVSLVTAPGAQAQVPQRVSTLTGAAEAPDPGDANGRGQFSWSIDGTRLCYLLSAKRIATAAAAHIHRGRAGVAGDVRVTLEAPAPRASAGCVDVEAALAAALRERPRRFYVNVHNADYPAGAIRGQLRR